MKKLLLLVLMSSVMGAAVIAQDHKDHKDMKGDHQQWEQKMKTELKLTDEQVTKFDALSKEYGDKMEALKNDASLTKEAQKAKKMELKKEKEGKLFEFLSAEQQTKYRSLVEEKKKEKPAGQ